jgi:hypothetical protein
MAFRCRFQRAFSVFMAFSAAVPIAENLLRPNQKLATSEDFS